MARKFTFKKTFELSTNTNNNKKEENDEEDFNKQKTRPALLCSLDKAHDDVYQPKTKKHPPIDIFKYQPGSVVPQPQYKKPIFTVNTNNTNNNNSPLFKDTKTIVNSSTLSTSANKPKGQATLQNYFCPKQSATKAESSSPSHSISINNNNTNNNINKSPYKPTATVVPQKQ
jgi:hypothetical protein